jgi:hypothetical protein
MVEVDFKGDREAFEESERELCPDGNCTGLLGADGRCKVCGKDASGNAPVHASEDVVGESSSEPDDDRKLCPDGNCVGLIGDDGRCKVCGAS